MFFSDRTPPHFPSDPLFSSVVSFFALILVYFPRLFPRIVFSPVLVLTGALLLSLLRLGATQRLDRRREKNDDAEDVCESETRNDAVESKSPAGAPGEVHGPGRVSGPCFDETFVEWNVRAPLEVIYEEYEGEEDRDVLNESDPFTETEPRTVGIERYPSLSLYYPETDSDSSSDGEFPAPGAWDSLDNMCFVWDEEDKEDLIEIVLDEKKKPPEFQLEEENFIEIDIFPTRNDEFPDEK